MTNPISDFASFISTEIAKAEVEVGPPLASIGTVLVKLENAVEAAIAKSATAEQAIAIIDPILQVLLGSLSGFIGPGGVEFLEKYVIPGVNAFITAELPSAAPTQIPATPTTLNAS